MENRDLWLNTVAERADAPPPPPFQTLFYLVQEKTHPHTRLVHLTRGAFYSDVPEVS